MTDFSSITSQKAAELAWKNGQLVKVLLLPAELGGKDIPDNVLFVPERAAKEKDASTAKIIEMVRRGTMDVSVRPYYRGTSFIPIMIKIIARRPGMAPEYDLEISIW